MAILVWNRRLLMEFLLTASMLDARMEVPSRCLYIDIFRTQGLASWRKEPLLLLIELVR